MMFEITPTALSRQEQFKIWMSRNRVTFRDIGKFLGVTAMTAGRLCKAEHAPCARVRELERMGIPPELLPRPVDMRPGPRKREVPMVPISSED